MRMPDCMDNFFQLAELVGFICNKVETRSSSTKKSKQGSIRISVLFSETENSFTIPITFTKLSLYEYRPA